MFPPFADLEAVAAKLHKTGKHVQLRKTLLQAWRAESCLNDLVQAQSCCDVLAEHARISREEMTPERHITERALLTTAIILYSRATSTSGKLEERGAIKLERGHFTREQWEDHQALIDLRNQCLAHVNPTYNVGSRIWHRAMLFAVRVAEGVWWPASCTNETGFHKDTFESLKRVLPLAHEIVLQKFHRRLEAASTQLKEANLDEKVYLDSQFDPVHFFGSADAVRRVLAGSTKGTDSFWVND